MRGTSGVLTPMRSSSYIVCLSRRYICRHGTPLTSPNPLIAVTPHPPQPLSPISSSVTPVDYARLSLVRPLTHQCPWVLSHPRSLSPIPIDLTNLKILCFLYPQSWHGYQHCQFCHVSSMQDDTTDILTISHPHLSPCICHFRIVLQ